MPNFFAAHTMIVVIGGEKGGTGKTTIATNLAQLRTAEGHDVLLVDADKQGSAYSWASLREENEISPTVHKVEKTGKNITKDLQDLADRYDDLIIDTGGRDTPELRASLLVADVLYIPIQASQFDIWSLEKMEELVSECQMINEDLQAFTVLNRASTNPNVGEVAEAEEIVAESEVVLFSGGILRERIAFRKASSAGMGVKEYHPQDTKAVNELDALYTKVYG